MAKLSKLLGVHTSKMESSHIPHGLPKEFPTGLRVLVVDDDSCTLKILKLMLMKCKYNVTDCFQAATALSILRENKGAFDVILTDVHMPGMNGFELLQLLGPEADLPIVMMSADNRPNVVMNGIQHGASDYLIKPLRMGELRNIWQHVVRKKQQVNNKYQHKTLMNGGLDTCKSQRKKRDTNKNDVVDLDTAASKKRVVWTVELHQQFVNAVNQLGIDKASPTKIRELMNVPGLTRENVSSHWQKYRLHVKRIAKVAQQLGVIPPTLFDLQPNIQAGFLCRPNFSALTVFDNVPPQNPASLHPELFGQSSGSCAVTGMNQTVLQQSSVQANYTSVEHGIQFTQPEMNLLTNIATESIASFLSGNPSNNLGAVSSMATLGAVGSYQNRSMLMDVVEQGSPLPSSNFSNALSMQPCPVSPSEASNSFMNQKFICMNQNSTAPASQSMDDFHGGNRNQKTMIVSFESQSIIQAKNDQLLSHSNSVPPNMGQHYDEGFTNIEVLNSFSFPGSTNLSISPSTYDNTNQLIQTPDFNVGQTNLFNIQDFGFPIENSLNQGPWDDLGSLGNDTFMSTDDESMIVSFESQSIIQAKNDQLLSHSNSVPPNMGQHYDEGFTNIEVLSSFSFPGSTNLSMSPSTYDNTNQLIQTPDFNVGQTNLFNIQDFGFPIENSLNQGPWDDLGSLGNDTFMSTDDVVDHIQSPINSMSKRNNCTDDDGNAEDIYSDFLDPSASQNIHNFPKGCLGF